MTLRVIAIGASAGGLEPLRMLLDRLPLTYPAAVIIAQHLSPNHASLLTELLGRSTRLPVTEITARTILLPGHVYVTPPNNDVEVRDGVAQLLPPMVGPGPKPRINRLFQSIAENCGEYGVGVVLSGTGTDGASGLKAIRNAGGLAIVQSLETCQHDGMPRAALDISAADFQMSPSELGNYLVELAGDPPLTHDVKPGEGLERLLALATRASGIELGRYRRKSLVRRVQRRMNLLRQTDLEAYIDWCTAHPEEFQALVNELFIHVTEFFRDEAAFDTVYETLRERLRNAPTDADFRVWVAGCSTGEEAYSIAMLLDELTEDVGRPRQYRLFASDVAERAIHRARAGIYPTEAVHKLGPKRIARYLTPVNDGYQINRFLRDRVVFSLNDLAKDAPFSRIDLITCRNLLIYFTQDYQRHILQTLHYSLRPGGLLMLGTSESISPANELFQTVSDTAHLFTKIGESRLPRSLHISRATPELPVAAPRGRHPEVDNIELLLLRELANRHAPATLIVNHANELVFSCGELDAFVRLPTGAGTLSVYAMLKEHLRAPVRAAMFQRRRHGSQANAVCLAVPSDQGPVKVEVNAFDPSRPEWLRISFWISNRPSTPTPSSLQPHDEAEAALFATLESELDLTRASLHMVVQELEIANDDLQTTNEELQSTNEEFQATNEELQTTNEELRSTNEELLTVNDELNQKTLELERANRVIADVLGSLQTPLLLVTSELRVQIFSPSIEQVVERNSIRHQDGLLALGWKAEIPELRDQVMRVIREGVPISGDFEFNNGLWQYRISPVDSQPQDGRSALILFVDVTELARKQQPTPRQHGDMERNFVGIGDALILLPTTGPASAANQAALLLFGVDSLQQIPMGDCGLRRVVESQRNASLTLQSLRDEVLTQRDHVLITAHLQTDRGEARLLNIVAQPLDEADRGGVLVMLRDVESSRSEYDRLIWNSTHDELTGFLTRRAFKEQLRKAARQAHTGVHQSLLFIDLDQFKSTNDVGGHAAGDEVLRQIAGLIRSQLSVHDSVGRLGGDEFCVILHDTTIDAGLLVAEKLRALIEALRVTWQETTLSVGASIGVAGIVRGDESGAEALAQADAACIQAKENGRNRVEIFSAAARNQMGLRVRGAQAIRLLNEAVDQGRLQHAYEIIRSLDGRRSARLELLTRVHGPDGAKLSMFHLITFAERAGLIRRIDERAFKEACRMAGLLTVEQVERIHLNVSPNSIAVETFVSHIEDALRLHPGLARRLCFEITETAAFSNLPAVRAFARHMRSLGAEIFLDDFGTGSSVLGQLRELRVDGLKIDGEFVRNMKSSRIDTTIVGAIQQVAEAMELITVAEYVPDASTAKLLEEMHVDYAQGDWSGREFNDAQILERFRH